MENKKRTFELLSSINVNAYTDKKGGLTYLSWAHAWSETKKAFPDASYQVKGNPLTQMPWFYDETLGYMVMTEVTIEGQTLEMWLPVMDGANKSMMKESYTYQTRYGEKSVDAATMFDINKTIMRCLVKNLAMFGMGIYIYAGEDLPETETQQSTNASGGPSATTPNTTGAETTNIALKKGTDDWNKVVKYVGANKGLGIDTIIQQLGRKYTVSPAIKKEISNIINEK